MLKKIVSNMKSIFSRGKVTLIRNSDAIQVQQVELHAGQVRSEIYAPQQYGIETAPHVGADTVCLFKGGAVESGYVIKTFDPRYKPIDLSQGDVCVYTAKNTPVATKARGVFSFTEVIENTLIPVGTIVKSGKGKQYVSTAERIIKNNEAEVPFEAMESGEESNIDGSQKLELVSPKTIKHIKEDKEVKPQSIVMEGGKDASVHRIWLKEVDGEILIETEGDINLKCANSTVEATESVSVTAEKEVNITAADDIKINTANLLTINAVKTAIKGSVDIEVGVTGVASTLNTVTFINGIATGII